MMIEVGKRSFEMVVEGEPTVIVEDGGYRLAQ